MSWIIGGPGSDVSVPPAQCQPVRLAASTPLDSIQTCTCNGLCSLFSIADNLHGLQRGITLEGDTTTDDLQTWSTSGCPLAKFLLSSTAKAGMETSAV